MMLSAKRRDKPESTGDKYGGPVADVQRRRGTVVFAGLVLGLLLVSGRLMQLHLNPDLELSDEERKHIGKVVLQHPRGEIFDRNGIVLATNQDVPSIWADPRKVANPGDLAERLSGTLGLDLDQLSLIHI